MDYDADTEAGIQELVRQDPRHPREAYHFVFAGLARAQQMRSAEVGSAGGRQHVRGPELLEALRDLALDEFGPLAYRVLCAWNIRRTEDFGRLVFSLIGAGLLSGTPEDSLVDFADGYEFTSAFVDPFVETGEMPADLPSIT
jgi:uncharacterized repeat protein (TIGR04138 family)